MRSSRPHSILPLLSRPAPWRALATKAKPPRMNFVANLENEEKDTDLENIQTELQRRRQQLARSNEQRPSPRKDQHHADLADEPGDGPVWEAMFNRELAMEGVMEDDERDEDVRLAPHIQQQGRRYPACNVRVVTYDRLMGDLFCQFIQSVATLMGLPSSGIVGLPTKTRRFTVLTSPHVDKKAREQFEMKTYKRLIQVYNTHPDTANRFMRYVETHMPVGVGLKFTRFTYETMPDHVKGNLKIGERTPTPKYLRALAAGEVLPPPRDTAPAATAPTHVLRTPSQMQPVVPVNMSKKSTTTARITPKSVVDRPSDRPQVPGVASSSLRTMQ